MPAIEPPHRWQAAPRWGSRVQSAAIVITAVVVGCVGIHIAAPFLIPVVVSLVICYALAPVVDRLERWHLPRPIAAAVVVLLLIAGGGIALNQMWTGAETLIGRLPAAVEKIRLAIAVSHRNVPDTLTHVQRTANELQKLAGSEPPDGAPPAAPSAVDLHSLLLMGTTSIVAALAQLLSVIFLTYFLLAAGDLFRHKLVQLVGPPFARQKATLEVLNHIHALNQRYLAILALVNVSVGVCAAVGLGLLGLEHAAIWGVAIAVLHFIPYVGAAVAALAIALMGYLQFGTAQMALAAASIPLVASVLIGVLLQASLLGRAASMNAPIVFIALLFWGTLWGAWGLLLAMPIMVAIKTICDRIEPLSGLGKFFGDDERTALALERQAHPTV
ncbi:MAG TPA: AI-2E family transporter [Casimicrobiaceae bacterium]|nr:AI-2E family transporter [Casimicrobiaceae bacterium]